jgi:hypothetical protein
VWVGCATPPAPLACPPDHTRVDDADGDFATWTCVDASGVPDGPRLRTYRTAPIWRQEWRAGALDGPMVVYQGDVEAHRTTWRAGRLDGPAVLRHPDGSLLATGAYRDGVPDGPWAFHRPRDPNPRWTLTLAAGEPALTPPEAPSPQRRIAGTDSHDPAWDAAFESPPPPGAEIAVGTRADGVEGPLAWRTDGPWTWAMPFANLSLAASPTADGPAP